MKPFIGLFCLLVFHSPDGSLLYLDRDSIEAIKPIPPKHRDHLAINTHAVIYTSVKSGGFGVAETVDEVINMIHARCE